MQGMRVQSLGREDALEKETATHSSILAWEILWTEETSGLQSMGLQKSQWLNNNNNITNLSNFFLGVNQEPAKGSILLHFFIFPNSPSIPLPLLLVNL